MEKTINPQLSELIFAADVAAERKPASLLIKNANLLNVFTNEIESTNVAIAGRLIAAVGSSYTKADTVVDAKGSYLSPGLIDGHLHIESALATPRAYAEVVLTKGVTGLACDPHEIANVSGVPGIKWLIEASEGLELDVWVTVPSSVPASPLETSGAKLGLKEIEELLQHPRVVGVAELMSFPDIIAADEENLNKVILANKYGKTAEGHAPGVGGKDLQAYLAAGITSDHEATTFSEGLEKLRSGVFLMIREGSVTRDLNALMEHIKPEYGDRVGFCTDDRLPHDLIDEGGVDCLVRRAINAGKDPVYAVRCASYNNALHYKLDRRGAIAAGYFADFMLIDNLNKFKASHVYKHGKLVAKNGELVSALHRPEVDANPVLNTVKINKLNESDFQLKISNPNAKVRCVEAAENQVLTNELHVKPKIKNGFVVCDTENDTLKLACIERHGKNGNIGLGLVRGFGLKSGAIASTVGHDHHNIMAVATNDRDLLTAANRLDEIQGGFVVVENGKVLAELQLEIAGLVSDRPSSELRLIIEDLEKQAKAIGCTNSSPFMTLSFLGLEVIPELRVTDLGLVNVIEAKVVSLEV